MKLLEMTKIVMDKMNQQKTFPVVEQDVRLLTKALYSIADRNDSIDEFYEELIKGGFITLESILKTAPKYRVSEVWADLILDRFRLFMDSLTMLMAHMDKNPEFEYQNWKYTVNGKQEPVFQRTELRAIEKYGGIKVILENGLNSDRMYKIFKKASEEIAFEKYAPKQIAQNDDRMAIEEKKYLGMS
jgi:hypothetical protein